MESFQIRRAREEQNIGFSRVDGDEIGGPTAGHLCHRQNVLAPVLRNTNGQHIEAGRTPILAQSRRIQRIARSPNLNAAVPAGDEASLLGAAVTENSVGERQEKKPHQEQQEEAQATSVMRQAQRQASCLEMMVGSTTSVAASAGVIVSPSALPNAIAASKAAVHCAFCNRQPSKPSNQAHGLREARRNVSPTL